MAKVISTIRQQLGLHLDSLQDKNQRDEIVKQISCSKRGVLNWPFLKLVIRIAISTRGFKKISQKSSKKLK